ncbi:unnamed protein product [Clavelina lepadiformis]|uniref:Uncharacterized protein n=1 Tax=Clavelina lepadiformis TaxID=159417 RepID=A0ABP0GUJ9_CLALP
MSNCTTNVTGTNIQNKTLQFRWRAANVLHGSSVSQNLLSHFLDTVKVLQLNADSLKSEICLQCHALFTAADHVVRLAPKQKFNRKSQKSIRKLSRRRGTEADRRRRESFFTSESVVKIKCPQCGFVNELEGPSRQELLTRKIKTPSRRKSGISNDSFTSPSTPMNASFSTPTPKKSKKAKMTSLSKLGTLLKSETQSPSSSLQDFLSSL